MSIHTRVCTFVCFLAAPLVCAGCAASPEESEEARLQVDTPLPHDPTDRFEIGPWWSDGTHLLNLRPDGGYSLYKDNNRYSRPIDRGRWGQQSYGTLWLLPYAGAEPQRIRVPITRIEGRIVLQPPRYGTMFSLAEPPRVREDDILGGWQGTMGALALKADSTYQFSPAPGALSASGEVIAGHNGRWSLNGDTVTLSPTTPSVRPITLKVRMPPPPTAGNESSDPAASPDITLTGFGGELVKIKAPEA